ncbi:hypothetical protein ACQR1W_01865 [Bradyrhizobium sp. HKCCYLS1011]|uniref:hypothetical protein n=1 Tax=Bradyrhizobium sp. HKCCYLS1011 TaxID=3420733 RepID=UPI003EBB15DB
MTDGPDIVGDGRAAWRRIRDSERVEFLEWKMIGEAAALRQLQTDPRRTSALPNLREGLGWTKTLQYPFASLLRIFFGLTV